MSKQLTSRIQGCAQRLTDIMSWQAKLDSSPLRLDTVWLYCLIVHVFFPYICAIAVWGKGQPTYIYNRPFQSTKDTCSEGWVQKRIEPP